MMSISEDFRLALQHLYYLKNPTIVKHVENGYKAVSLIVSDGERMFFVKKYHPKRSAERLLEVHRVKAFFKEHGVSTIPPLLNSEGSTLSQVNGEYFGVFPYISDKQYNSLPNDKAVASAGENLARLHLASVDHLSLVRTVIKPWNKEAFLKSVSNMLELAEGGATPFDKMAGDMLQLKMDLARHSSVSYEDLGLKNDVILHGDYHIHNLFFDDHDNVSYTFDFERTMIGPRVTDVANGLFLICFDFNIILENDVSDVHFERAQSYLRAYNNVFPFTPDELVKGIQWFFLSQMVYIEWPLNAHYLEHDTRSDAFLPKRFNRLEYFSKNIDMIVKKLS